MSLVKNRKSLTKVKSSRLRGNESSMEILAWLIAAGFGGAFFSNTKADIVDARFGETYTLSYYTTPYGSDLFSFAFERTANQVCPHGYEVVDKTNQPNDAKSSETRWLIACKKPEAAKE
jgi:hypothetical protein